MAYGLAPMDALLLTFMHTADEDQANHCLSRLIDEHAAPIVREILRSNLRLHIDANGGPGSSQDAGDLFNDIVLNLLSRLRRIKNDPAQDVIVDFRSYVAGTTYNACNLYLRQKFPRRSRLKNRLRYLLSHDHKFALWTLESSGLLCGLATWRDKDVSTSAGLLEKIRQDPGEWIQTTGLTTVDLSRVSLSNLLQVLFEWSGSPIQLDDLVNIVADICQEKDQPDQSLDYVMNQPTSGLSFEKVLEDQRTLTSLWREICNLPRRQRVALLLNFRDARGQELVSLLPHTRTATIEQIAVALEFPLVEFLELWNELPLDDIAIAQRMSCTRQQVINLRKCARERLERRMTAAMTKSSGAQ